MRFYKPKHFRVEEFLPPGLYNQYGERGLRLLMDPRILFTMDALRDKFGPITVNNYHAGGAFQQRGFRDDPGVGAPLSQHRFGRACDFDIKGVTAEEFRAIARAGKMRAELAHITRVEDGVSWVHIDVAGVEAPADGVVFFKA